MLRKTDIVKFILTLLFIYYLIKMAILIYFGLNDIAKMIQ